MHPLSLSLLCVILVSISVVLTLDNGLAITPPMGWMTWERFACNIDCKNYPNDCISERLIMTIADAMVKHGYKDAGYEYVSIDDCWLSNKRDSQGRLVADPQRFPSGIPALAKYVHSKGLKLGIYQDTGNATCQGYPGSQDHYEIDAETFASWGIDMLKFDGCFTKDPLSYAKDYPAMQQALNKTGHSIMYACEWPLYERAFGITPNYTAIARTCNMFRTYNDIADSWESIYTTLRWFGDNSNMLSKSVGPGAWVDPDQLVIGDYGLSLNQQRLQMALWSVMGAPLIVSADLRNMNADSASILLNKRAIAINQDPLKIMGVRKMLEGQIHVWMKPIMPLGSYALAIIYTNVSGGPKKFSVKLTDLGMTTAAEYTFLDVFTGKTIGVYKPWYTFDCEVNPTGVLFVQATASKSQEIDLEKELSWL